MEYFKAQGMEFDVVQDLYQMRLKNQFCDAAFRSSKSSETFPFHKVVLLAMSPGFQKVFSSADYEVELPNVSSKSIELMIDYAYRRQINFEAESKYVWDLMTLADDFDILNLSKLCLDFVTADMNLHSCLRSYKFARKTHVKSLRNKVTNYVVENFPKIDKHDANFRELSFIQVATLLCNPRLNANEEEVWEAALAWYEFDPTYRKSCMLCLLECVRLVFINKKFLFEKVICHEEVMAQDECRILILNRYRFMTDLPLIATVDPEDIHTPDMGLPRYPYDIMFIIGGCSNGKASNQMATYDRKGDYWKRLSFGAEHLQPRAYHACVAIDKEIYVIGGRDESQCIQSCQCFNVVTKEWRDIAPLTMPRSSLCAAVLDGCIYAISGSGIECVTQSTEKYDPKTNEWHPSADLNIQRVRAAGVTLGNYIFVAGGYDGQEYLDSLESYSVANGGWNFLCAMTQARSELCMAVYRDCLFAVGGYNGDQVLRSAEKYDRFSDVWTHIPEMMNPRCQFSMEVLDDQLVVAGGINSKERESQLVEKYNAETNEWYVLGDCEIACTAATGHCVVSALYDQMEDYSLLDRNEILARKVHYIARMKRRNKHAEVFRTLSLYMF